MTREQVLAAIQRGEEARALLESAPFVSAMNDLSNEHLRMLLAASPGETDRPERDHAHLMIHALRQITEELAARVRFGEDARADLLDETRDEDF